MRLKHIKIPSSRKLRIHGVVNNHTPRVWVAEVPNGVSELQEDTILHVRDAHGATDDVLAGEVTFSSF